MSEFPILQPDVKLLGRNKILKRLRNHLLKPTPANVSLVGPRYSGKTVILKALAEDMHETTDSNCIVVYWDLSEQIPQTDEEFIQLLGKQIAGSISELDSAWSSLLEDKEIKVEGFKTAFKDFKEREIRILVIVDDFHLLLRESELTRNLWDQLRHLFHLDKYNTAIITGSRHKLKEIIRDSDSAGSPFWNIFDVERLPQMDEVDLEAFVGKLPQYTFESGSLKEIMNWTGGCPLLIAWLLNRLPESTGKISVSNQTINELANNVDENCINYLDAIWEDIPSSLKNLYRHLVESGASTDSGISKKDKIALVNLGLATRRGSSIEANCRLIENHISGDQEFGALECLFNSLESYSNNIRGVLERRLSHIIPFDDTLFYMVQRAVEEIPGHPDLCLASLTQIENHALKIIWTWESDESGEIPESVKQAWTDPEKGGSPHNLIKDMMEKDTWKIPHDRSKQLLLLRLLTGCSAQYDKPLGKKVTKDAFVLLSAIHEFRNRSEHDSGQKIPLGVAVSGLMLCIELLDCLSTGFSTISETDM